MYLTYRGFAYTLFESPLSPVDWGIKGIQRSQRNARCLKAVTALLERFQPDTLVIEDCWDCDSKRSGRVRRLYRALESLARMESFSVYRYSRAHIRTMFNGLGARTKYEIAHAIARLIPAFSHRLPPVRKAWMPEDRRMALFDAAALALTHFGRREGWNREA